MNELLSKFFDFFFLAGSPTKMFPVINLGLNKSQDSQIGIIGNECRNMYITINFSKKGIELWNPI